MRWTIVLGLVATLAGVSRAGVLCATKAGALVARDACRAKEQAVDAAALAAGVPKGAPGDTGPSGVPGPARATAHVDSSGFVDGTSHLTAMSHPQTGVICITPDDTIDADASLALVTVDHSFSAGSSLLAYVRFPVASCPAGTFEVDTFLLNGNPTDDVAFDFAVI